VGRKWGTTVETIKVDRKQKKLSQKKVQKLPDASVMPTLYMVLMAMPTVGIDEISRYSPPLLMKGLGNSLIRYGSLAL
jgi:hypothetical protein